MFNLKKKKKNDISFINIKLIHIDLTLNAQEKQTNNTIFSLSTNQIRKINLIHMFSIKLSHIH